MCDAVPPLHESIVHATPSSGTSVSSTVNWQPVTASQELVVHGLASSQTTAVPPPQTLAVQV